MADVVLSLGTNVGDRMKWMRGMLERVHGVLGEPLRASRLMETRPIEVSEEHGWYLNCVVRGTFSGDPLSLLGRCCEIEHELGRTHKGMLRPRTADVDILTYNEDIVSTGGLEIPHPAILSRRFCLEGLAEVAPRMHHPVAKRTFEELRARMPESVARQEIRFREMEH